jgi:hypothetical protein
VNHNELGPPHRRPFWLSGYHSFEKWRKAQTLGKTTVHVFYYVDSREKLRRIQGRLEAGSRACGVNAWPYEWGPCSCSRP